MTGSPRAGDASSDVKMTFATKRRVLIAHPGTQHSFHLARELERRGHLLRFWTGFAIAGSGLSYRLFDLLPRAVRERLAARIVVGVPASKLRTLESLEWRSRIRLRRADQEEMLFERNRRFQEAIPAAEIAAADVVVGFDTSSWRLARRAKEMGKIFMLDQSIGHPAAKERVYSSLRQEYPAWRTSLPRKRDAHLAREREEHERADLIVVPSRFVRSTLIEEDVDPDKIRVIPFGTDLKLFHLPAPGKELAPHSKVVVLYTGAFSARKGLPVLLAAWQRLREPSAAELWLAGPGSIPDSVLRQLPDSVQVLGQRTRAELSSLMQQADAFVFPSHFEGLAQVQLEALATGLPVISTYESGAEEVILAGQNGLLVRAGDASGLTEALQRLVGDKALRLEMRKSAEKSRSTLSWELYGERWEQLLLEKYFGC